MAKLPTLTFTVQVQIPTWMDYEDARRIMAAHWKTDIPYDLSDGSPRIRKGVLKATLGTIRTKHYKGPTP